MARAELRIAQSTDQTPELQQIISCSPKHGSQPHGQGGGDGGYAHRLTPQNLVLLPEAKIDPPNREKMTFSRASPSLTLKNIRKTQSF